MSYENIHYDINSSILKFCKDFIVSNGLTSDWQVFDFDAHAGLNELPNKNLIGVVEYALTEVSDTYHGECMVLISTTQDDKNLVLLKEYVSKFFSKVKTGKTLELVNSSTGSTLGMIKMKEGNQAMAVARTESRPLQAIAISFGVTLISPP